MVAGRVVFENGRVTGIDEAALRREARAFAEAAHAEDARSEAAAALWLPYYREMYFKAAARDVGLRRCAGDRND